MLIKKEKSNMSQMKNANIKKEMLKEFYDLQKYATDIWQEIKTIDFAKEIHDTNIDFVIYSRTLKKSHPPLLGVFDYFINLSSDITKVNDLLAKKPAVGDYKAYYFSKNRLVYIENIEKGIPNLNSYIYVKDDYVIEFSLDTNELHRIQFKNGKKQYDISIGGINIDYVEKTSASDYRRIKCNLFTLEESFYRETKGLEYRQKSAFNRILIPKEHIYQMNDSCNPHPYEKEFIDSECAKLSQD